MPFPQEPATLSGSPRDAERSSASAFLHADEPGPLPGAIAKQMITSEKIAPFLARLRISTEITKEDEDAIRALPITVKQKRDGEVIVSRGDRPSACCLIVDGFVVRSKVIGDGRRQILAFHQPGDIPDLQSLFLHVLDHDMSTLGNTVVGFVPHHSLRQLIRIRPNIAEALWRDTLMEASIFREWICNVGQRDAASRLAHVVLELFARLNAIGRTDGSSFYFPATQALFADAIGTSTVHVNRVVQELRRKELLAFERGKITILDDFGLRNLADFEDLYLHLDPSL
jgi:CRP-like cAMP-binding protein